MISSPLLYLLQTGCINKAVKGEMNEVATKGPISLSFWNAQKLIELNMVDKTVLV